MSKLNVDQQTIRGLFSDNKADFLIPDYQRPYAWGEDECKTLWADIFDFAFPDGDANGFKAKTDEYYLGPIVTFMNDNEQKEIIDGQQRLTTLMLLLRAFYTRFESAADQASKDMKTMLEKCIWKTDELDRPQFNELKIDSEVATDSAKEEFLEILKTGVAKAEFKSRYADNYRYFESEIDDFIARYALTGQCPYLPARILNNCILLPIEAENQDTALRIFSTLNDRGLPLSDADIFKAQLYKYYSKIGKKDEFISRWKELEVICNDNFDPIQGTPMDELFTRYMYFLRAKVGNKKTTVEALRKFYENYGDEKYSILNNEDTLCDLEDLAVFWKDINAQEKDRFSQRVLRRLFVLQYAPNGMWKYIVSVYFLKYRDNDNDDALDEEKFYNFLNTITAFIWAYAIMRPGVNALRTPVFPELINIVNGKEVEFSEFKFDYDSTLKAFENYEFTNQRPVTKSILTWWAFNYEEQILLPLDAKLDIEHIYAKKRQEIEKSLSNSKNLESLGNKSILEKRINIRAADYKFVDKKRYYNGFVTDQGKQKEGTNINELLVLGREKDDFTETDLINRKETILNGFMNYLEENNLVEI